MRVRVLHVITDLGVGGAQVMLHRLLQASSAEALSQGVVSLTDEGIVGEPIRRLGIPVHAVGLSRRPGPGALLRLARRISEFRPDVVQTWMYHADLLGGLAARLATRAKVVWGIHNSTLDAVRTRRTTHWAVATCARLSSWVPDAIVSVSNAARELHVARGYAAEKFEYIPNGIDLDQFRPDAADREALRAELGLPASAVVIGLVARVAPQKDHSTFVRAAGVLARRRPEARFLLCGEGATPDHAELSAAIAREGIADRFVLLGRREDAARVARAIDVGALSSAWGEALPLVIAEAMASGVPCAVTNLGDCAHLVGDTGWVVPPRDPDALAAAWEAAILVGAEVRRRRGLAARARIAAHFSLPEAAERYASLYRRLVGAPPHVPAVSHAAR